MPTYIVYELQEVSEWRKYRHTVQADSAEEAQEIVMEGRSEPEDLGTYGSEDFGRAGYHVAPDEGTTEPDGWVKAAEDLCENV